MGSCGILYVYYGTLKMEIEIENILKSFSYLLLFFVGTCATLRKNLARNLSPAKFEISKMDAKMDAKMATKISIVIRNVQKVRSFLALY